MNGQGTHAFEQSPGATQVRVCTCGKWPDHHVHGADPCGCDGCRASTILQRIRDLHSPETPPEGHQWVSGGRAPHCAGCSTGDPYLDREWPCETRRLADGEDIVEPEPEPEEVTILVRP